MHHGLCPGWNRRPPEPAQGKQTVSAHSIDLNSPLFSLRSHLCPHQVEAGLERSGERLGDGGRSGAIIVMSAVFIQARLGPTTRYAINM
jgi:hypothetical protein